MKKTLIISSTAIGLIILLIGSYLYIKINPPLVSGTVGTGNEKQIVVVEVGNKGFKDLKITSVLVNNNENPINLNVQVSNPLKGFVITDKFDDNVNEEYEFSKIEDVSIQPNTSPSTLLKKVYNGSATENDKNYAVSVLHNKAIDTVKIKYSYFGFSFEETISINN